MNTRRALRTAFNKYAAQTFAWGELDCCLFTALVIKEVHGIDLRLAFPSYGSKRAAVAILRRYGSLQSLVSSVLGDPVDTSLLVDGDVAIIKKPTWSAVGPVCNGQVVFKNKYGVEPLPISVCDSGWVLWQG